MVEIETVVLREISLRLRRPFRISSGETRDRRILLLELVDRSGAREWSECVAGEAPNYSPETIDTAWLALRSWLIPAIIGRRFERASDVHPVLESVARGHPMAKAALEMGFWGVQARIEAEPLARGLGGSKRCVEVGISLGIEDSIERLVEEALAAREAGYRKVKVKIEPERSYEWLRAVREALGNDAPLAADANAAFSIDDLSDLCRLDELRLLMLEQPLDARDLLRHSVLQRSLTTPICLDESVDSVERAEDMIVLGSGKILNIKPGRVGGFTASLAISDRCREAAVPVWCGGMLESGIGRAYNVALASTESFSLPGDLSPSRRYWELDIVEPEWTMRPDGLVDVPWGAPGIGVRVDRERVERLTTRTVEVSPRST